MYRKGFLWETTFRSDVNIIIVVFSLGFIVVNEDVASRKLLEYWIGPQKMKQNCTM